METKGKVAVGLSGGVDSAVAAALLLDQGYSVVGITMKIWSGSISIPAGAKEACYGPDEAEDVEACQKLCSQLGIDYKAIDLAARYEERVIEYFKREYRAGRTPNPCVICNSELKFGFLVSRAEELGLEFDYFATGHYARIGRGPRGEPRLRTAVDLAKDQSYFLYRLGPEVLSRVLFPLGEMTKPEVRTIARQLGLELADKPESQDFIAGGDYSPLFADRPPEGGDIVDAEGKVLGQHRGLPYYTIGQRRGLRLGAGVVPAEGGEKADTEPLYVIGLDPEQNRVIVGPNRGLFADGLIASEFRSSCLPETPGPYRGRAKIRQNHKPVGCSFMPKEGGSCRVDFDDSQRALAPGQSVVIYDEEGYVLGGGVIESAL